jgi:hypothetical protein
LLVPLLTRLYCRISTVEGPPVISALDYRPRSGWEPTPPTGRSEIDPRGE